MANPKLKKKLIFEFDKPLHDFMVVKPFTIQEVKELERGDDGKSKPGIIGEDPEKRGKVVWGKVVEVGEGKFNQSGSARVPMRIKKGDIIIFSEYDSYDFIIAGVGYAIVREEFVFTPFKVK